MPGLPAECAFSGNSDVKGTVIRMNANCRGDSLMHEMGHNYGLQHSGVYAADGTVSYLAAPFWL